MRILCMLPASRGVFPPEAEERRMKLMRSYTTASTQVDADYLPGDSGFNPFGGPGRVVDPEQRRVQQARAEEFAVQRAIKAEQDDYDAFCPFGTVDLGVREARKHVRIPVVGQAEACLLFCGMLGRPFAACVYTEPADPQATRRAQARECGVDHLLKGVTWIGFPNYEYPDRRAEVLENFIRCTKEAKAMGAELMGLIAMSICPVEYSAKELSEASGFPVLDAMGCQIAIAELWHRTGTPPSLLKIPR